MIARIWHGWTRGDNAEAYENLLKEKIFAGIAAKEIPGYKGIRLLRRTVDGEEDEFVTIMWFDSWQAVKQFAGEDYEQAVVPPKARALLSKFDQRSQHYEVEGTPRMLRGSKADGDFSGFVGAASRDPSEEGISRLKSRSHMKYFGFR